MDLKLFPALFEKAKTTEIEIFDLRFEEAISLVEQDQFDEAVPLIENILEEGCLDIRLIMHLFYAQFLNEGIQSFTDTFPLIKTLIDEQWEKLVPKEMRLSHASKSIVWFFLTIGKRMKRSIEVYRKKRIDALWEKSIALSISEIEKIEQLTIELIDFFSKKWELPTSVQYTQYILQWLNEIKKALIATTPPPKKDTPPNTKEIPPKSFLTKALPPLNTLEEMLLSSSKMKNLHQKMELFQQLIKEKNFKKGALVGNDIQESINNFDPSIYFPKLFSEYFSLIAMHIDILLMEWENKGSPQWDSLDKLYRTDMEAFTKW